MEEMLKMFLMHGIPRSIEIQKKMPSFGTHIFWLGMPQGSQKYQNENIWCVSNGEILIFLFYVLINGLNVDRKRRFFALKYSWYLCVTNDIKNICYSAFTNSVEAFRHKNFENRLKNGCFMAMGTLKTCKIGLLLS